MEIVYVTTADILFDEVRFLQKELFSNFANFSSARSSLYSSMEIYSTEALLGSKKLSTQQIALEKYSKELRTAYHEER
jgi:hypothetical protein